jgi:succinyl-CoA synthetase beta subunit
MSKLFEYQGKKLLKEGGFKIPGSIIIKSISEADKAFKEIGTGVLKAQVFTTGRAALGLVKFPETLEELKLCISEMFEQSIKGYKIESLLYEEKLKIKEEYFAGITLISGKSSPTLIFSNRGGSGIEEIVSNYPESVFYLDINPDKISLPYELIPLLKETGITGKTLNLLSSSLISLVKIAIKTEAKSLEINPLVLTDQGQVIAADCHMTVDDYAVFRHPEFGIEIARELGHPPTDLEKIAYAVEKDDYRGTFYFIQLEDNFKKGEGVLGFHGTGGGGSMMSMDALQKFGYKVANFCDTSGNPPASKIYRAAKIILSQKNIDGYFGSGSGVASQEQFYSARGIVKALKELNPVIPVVFRLGGNGEERAIRILEDYTKDLRSSVRCYGKDTSVSECAGEMNKLIENNSTNQKAVPKIISKKIKSDYSFKTITNGTICFNYELCFSCSSKVCISECQGGILEEKNGVPVLNISREQAAKGKCTECLACEVECFVHGNGGGRIDLPIPGLDKEGRV